jgi:hypothetical protein
MRRSMWAGRVLFGCLLMAGAAVPAWARYQPPPACKNPFTPEQEITEGQKVAAQVYQQMPVLPANDPVTVYVRQLGARLVANAPGYKWPFSFNVVASADVNAFALPGGSIFVNVGTVQAAETEAQLAGVMAHEISHVVLRHSTCNMAKQQNKSVLYGLGSIASQILLGGTAGQLASGAIGLGASLDFLHMSRDDEKQADLLGVGILYDSGYDPRGLPQFFETIQAKYGSGGAQMLSDHPNPGNRTEYVNAEIATLPRRSNATVSTPEFAKVHALALKERTFTAKEVQGGVWKQAGRYAAGPGGGVLPVSSGGATGAAGQGPAQGPAPVTLSRAALGIDGRMADYQGARFALRYPAKWQANSDANGAVLFAPVGGAGASGIVYGALFDTLRLRGEKVTDASVLPRVTQALVQQLSEQNGGLEQVSQIEGLTVGGRAANGVELRGRSPVVAGGANLPERDWLATVWRPDGDLDYIVFVAPERDFAVLKPVFTEMLSSFSSR